MREKNRDESRFLEASLDRKRTASLKIPSPYSKLFRVLGIYNFDVALNAV